MEWGMVADWWDPELDNHVMSGGGWSAPATPWLDQCHLFPGKWQDPLFGLSPASHFLVPRVIINLQLTKILLKLPSGFPLFPNQNHVCTGHGSYCLMSLLPTCVPSTWASSCLLTISPATLLPSAAYKISLSVFLFLRNCLPVLSAIAIFAP
jgi:hypothetical protein